MLPGYGMKKLWPLLIARWFVFALICTVCVAVSGESLLAAVTIGVVAGGVLNVAWCWVA